MVEYLKRITGDINEKSYENGTQCSMLKTQCSK